MKKFFISAICLLLMIGTLVCIPKTNKTVFAAPEISSGEIIVIGSSEIKVAPDTVTVTVGVDTRNEDASVAESENRTKVNEIINILVGNGIKRENIKTANYNMYRRYNYQQGEEFIGYQVSNMLSFSTSADRDISALLSSLTEAGITTVSGVTFSLTNHEKAYNEALASALANAESKVAAIAGGKQYRLKKLTEENYAPVCSLARVYAGSALSESTNAIEKGDYSVTATIKAVFEII